MLPRSPKRSQLMAKIAQNTPQEPPTRPPKTPKCGQNDGVLFVFTLRPFFSRSLPRPTKMLKKAPQMASRWPSWPQLGSSWRHLGSNLAPSCPIWARFWSIRAWPKLTKISQDSFGEIFCFKVAPKSSQTPSRPPPDLDFSSFQIHFSKVCVNFSKHLFIDYAFKVFSFSNTFS